MNALSSMPPSARKDSAPKARPLRILYAEDMRDLREIARMSLTREGHTIECVADGSLALEKLTAAPHSVDLLLTDHHMPVMNGLALVTALRATPFSGKIIVFSSELNAAVGNQYRKFSVSYILQKPVFPSDLRRVIADLFPAEPDVAVR
ncbi:MAG: response regulator [Verrucomicrobia bacterium]|nr:response regulator [Verrucomicrobiota bacterium]